MTTYIRPRLTERMNVNERTTLSQLHTEAKLDQEEPGEDGEVADINI